MKQIASCPKCGNKVGWFERLIITGQQFYDQDGKATHFADDWTRGGKRKYCGECGRDITDLVKWVNTPK